MSLPAGTIILWSGAIVDIPPGWILCNGAGGSPDLRNNFIVGAGDTYNPDDSGGNINHTHPFTGDGHVHNIPVGISLETGTGWDDATLSGNATGDTDNANGLPPYHALAYIMKT